MHSAAIDHWKSIDEAEMTSAVMLSYAAPPQSCAHRLPYLAWLGTAAIQAFCTSPVGHACVRHLPVPTCKISPSNSPKLFNTFIKSAGKGKKDSMAETT